MQATRTAAASGSAFCGVSTARAARSPPSALVSENDCFTAMCATIDLASKADAAVQIGTRELGEIADDTVLKPHSKGPLTRVLGCSEST